MSAASPLFFCLRLPEFAAQALLRLRSEQRRQAVAVLDGAPPLETICAMNTRARNLGAIRGLTRAELASVPDIVLLRRSIQEEQNTRAALLEMAWGVTPRVEELPDATDCVLALDMSGSERLWGTSQQAAEKILHAVRRLNLSARVAVAANLQTAVCISRMAREPVTIVPQGNEAECLAELPLAALEPSPEHAGIFALWDIRTAGKLAALPAIDLVTRLGQEGRRLWLLARGECKHLLVPSEPAFTLEERMDFDEPIENLDSLLFILGPMLQQLLVRAACHALALASVTVTFTLDGGGEHKRTVKPALALTDRAILLKLLHLDLQAHPPAQGIVAAHLVAEPGVCKEIQTGLFLPQTPEPVRLEVTLARIAALVGEDRVGCAVLTDSHAPESFRMERFVAKPATARRREMRIRHEGGALAIRRLRPSVPIGIEIKDSKLRAFHLDETWHVIERAFGPWRRSGEWWTEEVWSREEWDVESTASDGTGMIALLAHDRLRRCWYLEALYD